MRSGENGVHRVGESDAVSLGDSRPVVIAVDVGRSTLSGIGGDRLKGDTNDGRRILSAARKCESVQR